MSLVAEGPLIQVVGRARVEQRDGVGHVGDHLVGTYDAHVHVGDEGERATALARAVREHDRAGRRDPDRGSR